MRKFSLILAALAFASVAGGSIAGSAAPQNCTPSGAPEGVKQRTASDEFGSCETTQGNVKCGRDNATAIGDIGYLSVDPSKGAQVCSEDGNNFPIAGRITVVKHSGNTLTVAADGGDTKNSGGASAWSRADVNADSGQVCFRRGTSGTYWTKNKGTSSPDFANYCVPA
ncbi:MAG: hypothetical protein ACLGH3_10465 [Actinomycetota bacterium]